MTPRLKERYDTSIQANLKEKLAYDNVMDVPCLDKIVVNMGVGDAISDARMMEMAVAEMATITGQKPSIRRAKKSVSNFKVRQGMPVGCMVTLRGARKYEFFQHLVKIALPQIRDFRGLNPDSFDGRGNYAMGVAEQVIFPEIDYDDVSQVQGMNIVMATTAGTDEHARELLKLMGMPFRDPGDTGQI